MASERAALIPGAPRSADAGDVDAGGPGATPKAAHGEELNPAHSARLDAEQLVLFALWVSLHAANVI